MDGVLVHLSLEGNNRIQGGCSCRMQYFKSAWAKYMHRYKGVDQTNIMEEFWKKEIHRAKGTFKSELPLARIKRIVKVSCLCLYVVALRPLLCELPCCLHVY